jgi:uncharacterized YccA/Bax inhibitor family protein
MEQQGTMTVEGTATKTGILLLLVLVSSLVTWSLFAMGNFRLVFPLMIVGMIGGLVVALITIFKPKWASVTAPTYAIFEGLLLGGLSAAFEFVYPGILFQAVALTFGVFALVLVLYRFRVLRATPRFVKGIIAATGAIMFVYLIGLVLLLFGVPVFFFSSSDPISIGFSVFVVAIASLNFVLDFGFIEEGANRAAPKHLEWYAAFGLLVTLIWLYIEILRLLAKLRSR